MSVISNTQPEWLSAQLQQLQLGLLNKQGEFSPAPISLTPWQLAPTLWLQAQRYSRLLGRLLYCASSDTAWLLQQLHALDNSSLPGKLAAQLQQHAASSARVAPLPIMRHDFLLDNNQQWRWVESNVIAAGMGPLNAQLVSLLAQLSPASAQVANPAIAVQATALYQAAAALRSQYDAQPPVIVFVVEPAEDNVFDQLLLQQALEGLGATVLRRTLTELTQASINGTGKAGGSEQRLTLATNQTVDLLYFRTGYNVEDYANAAELTFRASLQQLALVQCPDVPLQLAGSKWLQAALTALVLSDQNNKLQRWGFTHTEHQQLRAVMVSLKPVMALPYQQAQRLLQQGWLLKSQHEGGGSVLRGEAALQQLQVLHKTGAERPDKQSGWLIMAPIQAAVRHEPLTLLRHETISQQQATISELGMFSVGATHNYGGYLLRSKAATQLEGGVHRGGAVLDTIELTATPHNLRLL